MINKSHKKLSKFERFPILAKSREKNPTFGYPTSVEFLERLLTVHNSL